MLLILSAFYVPTRGALVSKTMKQQEHLRRYLAILLNQIIQTLFAVFFLQSVLNILFVLLDAIKSFHIFL